MFLVILGMSSHCTQPSVAFLAIFESLGNMIPGSQVPAFSSTNATWLVPQYSSKESKWVGNLPFPYLASEGSGGADWGEVFIFASMVVARH